MFRQGDTPRFALPLFFLSHQLEEWALDPM